MRVRAYAKLNLTLEVLSRRPDGFHDLRSVFQTVSVHDVLDIEAARSRTTRVSLASDVEIPGENLIVRAAHAVLEAAGVRADVSFRLKKRIPMGAGMGGGSADAAAVLRALPGMLGKRVDAFGIGATLGSDVPYFLLGGTALGLGRGTELYPLPDLPPMPVLIVAPRVHVATGPAYASLGRTESYVPAANRTERFARTLAWAECANDFEDAVFAREASIAALRRKLARTGALTARMTGSGSALFGVFATRQMRDAAALRFPGERVFRAAFVPRKRLGVIS